MPVVKIINPSPYDWRGTQCFIDGNKVPRVKSVDFHIAVDEIPTFVFEMMAEPDIEVECLAQISFTSQSITDAISVLRHELLQHGQIYHGFKASLKSALEHYNYCGLPFEPEAAFLMSRNYKGNQFSTAFFLLMEAGMILNTVLICTAR